jgi:hypothetical protein
MIEQILHFTAVNFRATYEPDDPFPHYTAHTPPKWNGDIECVSLVRATPEVMAQINAEPLGDYPDISPESQAIIDRCYDRTPVPIPDTDPPEFYTPPVKIGEFA